MIFILLVWYPKCSTCQRAKKYLESQSQTFEVRDIVLNPLSEDEIRQCLVLSNKSISSFFNTSGLKYRSMRLKDKLPYMTEDEKLVLLASDGMLVKRPLLILEDRVFVGFREKEWSDLFENC